MSSIPHNVENRNEISNSVSNFMKEFQIGQLLFKCNAAKVKEIQFHNLSNLTAKIFYAVVI